MKMQIASINIQQETLEDRVQSRITPYGTDNYRGLSYVLGDELYAPENPQKGEKLNFEGFQSFRFLYLEVEDDFAFEIVIYNASAFYEFEVINILNTLKFSTC